MEELLQRLQYFRERFDLRAKIAADPWRSLGLAALAGLWLGYAPPRFTRTRSKVAEIMLAAIGAVTLRMIREAAFRHVATVAKAWWDEAAAPQPQPSA